MDVSYSYRWRDHLLPQHLKSVTSLIYNLIDGYHRALCLCNIKLCTVLPKLRILFNQEIPSVMQQQLMGFCLQFSCWLCSVSVDAVSMKGNWHCVYLLHTDQHKTKDTLETSQFAVFLNVLNFTLDNLLLTIMSIKSLKQMSAQT